MKMSDCALAQPSVSVGMGRPMPGHARAVEGGEGSARIERSTKKVNGHEVLCL
jgi:hypothetical protein